MYHRIIREDEPEGFILTPFLNGKQRLMGFRLTLRTPLWQSFVERGMTWPGATLTAIERDWKVRFHPFSEDPRPGTRFGFSRGLVIDRIEQGWVSLRALFCKDGWSGFSTAANLDWLLDFLYTATPAPADENTVPQLFAVDPYISIEPRIGGCGVTVTVGRYAAALLDALPEQTDFPRARELINELWRYHGVRLTRGTEYMRAHTRDRKSKSVLSVSAAGNCNCLGINPDERMPGEGYDMPSHNTDSPTDQLSLLMGIAEIWKELREKLPHNPLS